VSTIAPPGPPASEQTGTAPVSTLQRRTIVTLVAAQVAGGMGLAAAVTVGGLIAADLGSDAAAGLPLAASVAGTAMAALPLAAVMRRSGRRPGLRLGWLVGAVGASVAVAATMLTSLPLLLAGMVLFGGAEAASSAARYAAADLAVAARRGTAIGTVVSSTALTATVGPSIVGPATATAAAAGLPALAGPFVVSVVAFAVASAVITVALRPDPLLIAATAASSRVSPAASTPSAATARLAELVTRPGVRLGITAVVIGNLTMLSLMTVTPLHLTHMAPGGLGAPLHMVGLVISVHVGGMFAPSPLTGWLGDHFGHRTVVTGGAVLIGSAGLAAAAAGQHWHVLVALLLLGIGWNFAFIGGSTLLTGAVPAAVRPRVQGIADMAMGVAGVLGAASSGAVMAWGGFGRVGLLCAGAALALLIAARWRIVH
jgi:MFS family permease